MDSKESVGIKLEGVIHKKCKKSQLIDYIGYIWCDYCQEIVDSDIDSDEILFEIDKNQE